VWVLANVETLVPPIGARWGLLGSWDGDFTGLAPVTFSLLSQGMREVQAGPMGLRLLQMGSVDYAVAFDPAALGGLPVAAESSSLFVEPLRLLRVPGSFAKAYAVDGVRPAREPDSLTILSDPRFDPRHEVVLAADVDAGAAVPGFAAEARVVRRTTNEVEVDAALTAPGVLVLVEAFRPGWVATVDGAPAEVLRANVLFRAVRLAGGRHRVLFRYRPASVPWGAATTVACAAAGLVSAGSRRRARPGSRGGPHAGAVEAEAR
jgi:hypothetical protein